MYKRQLLTGGGPSIDLSVLSIFKLMAKKIFHTIWYGVSENESYNRAHESLKKYYDLNHIYIKKHEQFYSSNYHVEIDMTNFPHDLIYEWIEEFSSTTHVHCTTKLIILRHFDLLSVEIQQAFRMLMEDRSVRLYITALWIDKIDDAIQSRCVSLRVPVNKSIQNNELLKIASQPCTRSSITKWLTYCKGSLYLKYLFKSYKSSPPNLEKIFKNMLFCCPELEPTFLSMIT